MLLDDTRSPFETVQGQVQFAMADGGGADDQRAIGDGFAESLIDLGGVENFLRADGGARSLEGDVVGMHEAEVRETKIADRACGSADVERIARIDEDDSEVCDLFGRKHPGYSTAGER